MSRLPARAPGAAVPDRPTLAGERALREALGYIGRADAPGTRRACAGDWRHFTAWCLAAGFAPLPAGPATLAAYLAAHAEAHAPATLRRRLAAIARVREPLPPGQCSTSMTEAEGGPIRRYGWWVAGN